MLDDGAVQRYIDSYSVTGLTSNPSIFDKAIESGVYDDAIREKAKAGLSGEDLFFDLAIEDLRRAADLFLADPRTHRRRRRLGVARGLARCSRTTPRRRSLPPRTCTRVPAGATCSSRSRAPTEGLPAITESHRGRRAGERHAAVLEPTTTAPPPTRS